MSDTPSTRILDHIVHLTPPGTLPEAVEQFRDLGFTVIDGGVHAGGLTANALVILPSGAYVELIHFTRTPAPDDLLLSPWANKPPGFIALAFLGSPGASPSITSLINNRAKALGINHELQYLEATSGGRTRPDGEKLEWEIVAPARWAERRNAMGRPFFCGDVTPRRLRVPLDDGKRQHANLTRGVAYLRLLVARDVFNEKVKEVQAVLGLLPLTENDRELERTWELESPNEGKDVHEKYQNTRLVLAAANESDPEEVEFVEKNGTGLFEVGFAVEDGGGSSRDRTPYARVTWHTL